MNLVLTAALKATGILAMLAGGVGVLIGVLWIFIEVLPTLAAVAILGTALAWLLIFLLVLEK